MFDNHHKRLILFLRTFVVTMVSLLKHHGVITDCYDSTVRDKVVGILSFQDFCVEKQSSGDTSDRTHTKNVMAEKHGKRRKPCVKLKHCLCTM